MKYSSTKSATVPRQPSPLPSTLERNTGNSRMVLAKMIGTTPDWLTFSGM